MNRVFLILSIIMFNVLNINSQLYSYTTHDRIDSITTNITTTLNITFAIKETYHRRDTISGNLTVSFSFDVNSKVGDFYKVELVGTGNAYTINHSSATQVEGAPSYDDTAGKINHICYTRESGGRITWTNYITTQ